MLRLRLASLALASGLLMTLSGCLNTCAEPMFPRMRSAFASRSVIHGEPVDCECHGAAHMPVPADFASMQGPQLPPGTVMPMPSPIPVTNVPAGQPPSYFRVPQASPMPYAPTIK